MFKSHNHYLSYVKAEDRFKINFVFMYPPEANIVRIYFELNKIIVSHWCELNGFKNVLYELPVYLVKSRRMT